MSQTTDIATVCTEQGDFKIELFTEQAPITANYFKQLVSLGALNNTSFYRIVSTENGSHNPAHPIHVLQGGLKLDDSQPVPPIKHEDTQKTGLRHLKWSLSTARFEAGQTYGSFFICMRDEPALDFGGLRHPDGLGFAVFGRVISDFEVIEAIFQRCEEREFLQKPIGIDKVTLTPF